MKTDRTMSLGRNEIDCLTETLHAQQELLQKLYYELDVERESSGIAADEALSMILRLQGEKAAVGMEASQYKRIAEEKMCHAQEMLEMFQELIYQKEMQIASLEFQVQAYKFKLVSLGCHDLGSPEMQYPDNMLLRSARSSLKRGNSLPPPILDALSRRTSTEGEKSTNSSPKPSPIRRENTSAGDFNSYWEDIKKLDERIKELAITKAFDCNNSHTPEAKSAENGNGDSHKDDPEKVFEVKACADSPCSAKVQDIFEVPQCLEQHNANEKIDWEKKPLLSPDSKIGSPQLSDPGEKIEFAKKPKEGKIAEKQMLFKHPTYGVGDFEVHQLNRRLKQLEDERFVPRVLENNAEREGAELRLLQEIREKIDSMEAQIMSLRTTKPRPREDHSVGCIREAMLCFWP